MFPLLQQLEETCLKGRCLVLFQNRCGHHRFGQGERGATTEPGDLDQAFRPFTYPGQQQGVPFQRREHDARHAGPLRTISQRTLKVLEMLPAGSFDMGRRDVVIPGHACDVAQVKEGA